MAGLGDVPCWAPAKRERERERDQGETSHNTFVWKITKSKRSIQRGAWEGSSFKVTTIDNLASADNNNIAKVRIIEGGDNCSDSTSPSIHPSTYGRQSIKVNAE